MDQPSTADPDQNSRAQPVVKPDSPLRPKNEDAPTPQVQIPGLQAVIDSIKKGEEIPSSEPVEQPLKAPVPDPPTDALSSSSQGPSAAPAAGLSAEVGRPLDVTDALTYLDAVKLQFQDKPDVYNHFLDIMKDFKSQVIDTPGVIERVSMLFNGHPDLIQGFNTFLPPGYRIECSIGSMESSIITVTTPSGTTTQSTDLQHPFRLQGPASPSVILGGVPQQPLPAPVSTHPLSAPSFAAAAAITASSRAATPQIQSPFAPAPGSPIPYGSAHAASFLGGLGGKGAADKQGPPGSEEFHHAIQYVNKIKTRFEDDTDTYKQFLEILHAYRKEQKVQDDSQVYAQVQVLFKNAPDLLAEFKDFLPSASGPAVSLSPGATAASLALQQEFFMNTLDSIDMDGAKDKTITASEPPRSNLVQRRKKRPIEREVAPAPPPSVAAKVGGSRTKKLKNSHNKFDLPSPTFPAFHSHPPSPAQPHTHAPTHGHAQPPGPSLHSQQQQLTSSSAPAVPDDVLFFERAKKALDSRETYEDFLKLLALFAKEIIDTKTLVQRAEAFFGDGELLMQFKELLGWDEKKDKIEDGPQGAVRSWSVDSISRPARETEERYGASYRRLPDAETKLACSGRDELCRSVLNDVWVSHPTWASEESSFVSHKKNTYEEALHKSEEERHEYQFYIEIITRTIALLQPVYDRIVAMAPEERHALRLQPADFGGASRSIWQRAVKKVYGRDGAGPEVLQALQECPGVAVPVVLPRLKQKNEEWRRAQRDWNRVWREVDARNFYKSLDHQGITFKANDKKNITAKNFVAEMEAAKAAADASGRASGWHLEYEISDVAVLQDALKLVFSFLDRTQAQYSAAERRGVERLLRALVPLLFMLPAAEFDAAFGNVVGGLDGEEQSEDAGAAGVFASVGEDADDGSTSAGTRVRSGGRRSAGGNGGGGGGVPPGDLRKKLLKTAKEKARSASESRAPSPSASEECPPTSPKSKGVKSGSRPKTSFEELDAGTNFWVDEDEEWAKLMRVSEGITDQRPFFANTTFYTLLRLLQLLYSRLLLCKEIADKLAHRPAEASLFVVNPVAEELGLVDSTGPGAVLAVAGQGDGAGSGGGRPEGHFYEYLLDACEKVFDGELEQGTFEENMRFLFGTKAFNVFTLDKLIAALIKQAQTVVVDNKCQELLGLLARARSRGRETSVGDVMRYRRAAEQFQGGDDHLYRVEWSTEKKAMQMQMLGSSDPSVRVRDDSTERWRAYSESYVLVHATEVVECSERVRRPFLSKSVMSSGGNIVGRLEVGISSRYRVLYRNGSEDMVWRE